MYLALLPVLLGLGANAQLVPHAPTNFSTWFPITDFPNAQAENVSYWQAEAQRVAGKDLWSHYERRCIMTSQKYPELGSTEPGFIAPARPFDSVFFVGTASVSAWAIDTGEGLILIDALYNKDEAEKILIPGLQRFGYGGKDIKTLIITHEHGDHYGGAPWIQEQFGATVYCSEACWQGMDEQGDGPKRDQVLEDGQTVRLGNTTIQAFITPGHTDGTTSLLIPLYDRGVKHLGAMYGGNGLPRNPEDMATQIESYQRFAEIARSNGADVLMGNHQSQDYTLPHLDILANRVCSDDGECSVPNPYVVGTEVYARYLKVMEICVRIKASREGQNLRI